MARTLLKIERRKYSQTELHTYMKCGKMWEFRYLLGYRKPPGAAATVGVSVDRAVSINLEQKIKSGTDLPETEVVERYSADFDSRIDCTEWGSDDPGKQKDIGVRLVRAHHESIAPRIVPQTVQERFVIAMDAGSGDAGYDLEGIIDFTEKNGFIVDTKTSRSAMTVKALEKALQPALYDYAYEVTRGAPSKGFRLDVLIKPNTRSPARIQQLEGQIGRQDREWLFGAISQVDKAIRAGVAMPAPEGSWYCSREWCGFWKMCKGKTTN